MTTLEDIVVHAVILLVFVATMALVYHDVDESEALQVLEESGYTDATILQKYRWASRWKGCPKGVAFDAIAQNPLGVSQSVTVCIQTGDRHTVVVR